MTELFPGAEGSEVPVEDSGNPGGRQRVPYSNEYGMGAAMDRHAALAPAGAVSLEETKIDQDKITEPEAGIPVWADLVYLDGRAKTVKAFAQKWTPDAVYVQYVDRGLPAYVWVRPDKVNRRQLEKTRAERR